MTKILIGKKYYDVPTNWNELTGDQLVKVLAAFNDEKYNEDQRVLVLFKILLNVGWWRWFRISPFDLQEYLYLVVFFYREDNILTRQLLPSYKGFHGPDDEISNLVMKEFVMSEHFFMQWQEDKQNEELLNEFVATIYRPAKKNYDFSKNEDGDCRINFNSNLCSWNAKNIMPRWPLKIKNAIAHWYAGCRLQMVQENPEVFGGSGEPAKHGLISVMRDVAKNGAYGKFDDVENMYVSLLMIELNEAVEEGRRMEKAMKSTA
jgi:hypothetical protein